jgi:drug/metabolite transporter (DMT)-like permease
VSGAHERARGRLMILGAATSWGTSATLARFLFRDLDVPPLAVVELRLVIAVLIMTPWIAWRTPRSLRVAPRDWGYLLALGIAGVAAIQGSYYYTISVLGVGLGILLQYLAPSLIVVYAALRGARIGPATAGAVLAAIAGTALLVGNVDLSRVHATPLDWTIGFLSAFAFASYILFSKRAVKRYPPETVLLYTFAVAALLWMVVTPPARILAAGYAPTTWLLFVVLSVFSVVVPFTLFYGGLRRLTATEASILATFEPVVAIVSAAVVLGEGLSGAQWAGAALVLAAALLATRANVAEGSGHA